MSAKCSAGDPFRLRGNRGRPAEILPLLLGTTPESGKGQREKGKGASAPTVSQLFATASGRQRREGKSQPGAPFRAQTFPDATRTSPGPRELARRAAPAPPARRVGAPTAAARRRPRRLQPGHQREALAARSPSPGAALRLLPWRRRRRRLLLLPPPLLLPPSLAVSRIKLQEPKKNLSGGRAGGKTYPASTPDTALPTRARIPRPSYLGGVFPALRRCRGSGKARRRSAHRLIPIWHGRPKRMRPPSLSPIPSPRFWLFGRSLHTPSRSDTRNRGAGRGRAPRLWAPLHALPAHPEPRAKK